MCFTLENMGFSQPFCFERICNKVSYSRKIYLSARILIFCYQRIVNKDWFLADVERCKKKYPREFLESSYEGPIKKVLSYEHYGFK